MPAQGVARVDDRGLEALRAAPPRGSAAARRGAASEARASSASEPAGDAAQRGRLIYWFDPICCRHSRPGPFVNVAPEPSAGSDAARARAAPCAPACSPSARRSSPRRLPLPPSAALADRSCAARSSASSPTASACTGPSARNLTQPPRSPPTRASTKSPRALPYARRAPRAMEFRRWDGGAPTLVDECGIGAERRRRRSCPTSSSCPASASPPPAIGSATAAATTTAGSPRIRTSSRSASPGRSPRSTSPTFAARPHDVPLTFIVTEHGVR